MYVHVTVVGCVWSSIQCQPGVWLHGHRSWGRSMLCILEFIPVICGSRWVLCVQLCLL